MSRTLNKDTLNKHTLDKRTLDKRTLDKRTLKKNAYVVGVTGGIGSGKTAVTRYLADKGITVVDADLAARIVVQPGRAALQAIAGHFGAHLIQTDGQLDRAALREIIFTDAAERHWLEQLLHPLIRQEIIHQLQQATSPYRILVSPLMVETDQQQLVNRLLVVDVPRAVQIERTLKRDAVSRGQVEATLNSQASREQRLAAADDVVENSGSLAALHQQLEPLHRRYLALARQHG
jgi:dephospho-CoA kinase